MHRFGRASGAALWGLLLASCATPQSLPPGPISLRLEPSPLKPPPLQLSREERLLLGGPAPDWGLALSGGGLRSAFFSLGVVKALYDKQILDRIDVISTVSGGGYTGYWLYANHLRSFRPGQRFGQTSLADHTFPTRLCELITTSNFVPYGRLRGLLTRSYANRSIDLYEDSLRRTFGGEGSGHPLRLSDFKRAMQARTAPFLVQNATFIRPANNSWARSLLEFTPLSYGTDDFGRIAWTPATEPAMRKTTAVSGAAFGPLNQVLELKDPQAHMPKLAAHDGGKSENLGAIALIRRGVPNVIIADAEHDPGYVFDAYRVLRAGLEMYGLELTVRDIDNYLMMRPDAAYARAVATGQVRQADTKKLVSTIYYIKAAMADDVSTALAREMVEGSKGQVFQKKYYQALAETRQGSDRNWRCDMLIAPTFPTANWAAYNVATYSDWLKTSTKSRFMKRAAGLFGIPAARIEFPQYSTADQSFYIDQAQAFAGLGYLEAKELKIAP